MRTTIRIDDELLVWAKAHAAERRTSLNAVIEDALRASLNRQSNRLRPSGRLPAMTGRGLRPGVNLNCNAELLDLMDQT
jgi:hypothetical protein